MNLSLIPTPLEEAIHHDDELSRLARLILNGKIKEAILAVDSALQTEQASSILLLKMRWLAECYQYNLYPDGAGGDGLEISDRWDGVSRANEIAEHIKLLQTKFSFLYTN